jgi:hypothetical protein
MAIGVLLAGLTAGSGSSEAVGTLGGFGFILVVFSGLYLHLKRTRYVLHVGTAAGERMEYLRDNRTLALVRDALGEALAAQF